MGRSARALIAFLLGATFIATSLLVGVYMQEVADWLASLQGRPALNASQWNWFHWTAHCFLLGGLLIEGLALLGWIIAPRDDR